MTAVILSGANPGVRLTDGDVVTAFASVWAVDWSVRGAGTALVLWHVNRVRTVGITVAGHPVPGEVTVGGTEHRPSSAFLATAEVWSV